MCGFIAAFGNNLGEKVTKSTEKIIHRGPDETNYLFLEKENIYLGHNRLTIMDLKNGKQPFKNKDESLILLFNGEIYNQNFFREKLKFLNIHIESKSSDTEVLLKSYETFGEKIFSEIDGQFAICLIDRKKKELVLVRDKFGEKPLFYHVSHDKIIIASQLDSFKFFLNENLEINPNSLAKFFMYSHVPPPNTIYKNIFKLEHAHFCKIKFSEKKIVKKKYYEPTIKEINYKNEQDYIEKLDSLISESTKLRLNSDVEIGLFLSGGLDSSLAAYYMINNGYSPKSFSISIDNKYLNEEKSYQFINNLFKLNNYQIKLSKKEFEKEINSIADKLDEPLGATTYVTMFFLSKLASQKVKTVITGDGADEIFGGYEMMEKQNLINYINSFKLNKTLANSIKIFEKTFSKVLSSELKFKLSRFEKSIVQPPNKQNLSLLSTIPINEIDNFFVDKLEIDEVFSDINNFNENYQYLDVSKKNILYFYNFYLPNLICARSDKAGMFNSLEIRSIFLTSDILEFALSIPRNKSHLVRGKNILKKIASNKIHKRFSSLKKGGFTYPINEWLDYSINKKIKNTFNIKNINGKNPSMRNLFHCLKIMDKFL